MNPPLRWPLIITTALVALIGRTPCRADLFAFSPQANQIHRIDSDSGQLLQTYDVPLGPTGGTLRSGLAFDGRTLYLSRSIATPLVDIMRFDVIDELWLDPAPVFLDPVPPIDGLAGLGFSRQPDRQALVGVNWGGPQSGFPLQLIEFEVFDSIPSPYGNVLPPFAPLIGEVGLGLDVDPATDDIWLVTRQPPTATHFLHHLDRSGNLLETLTLPFTTPTPIVRGVGFDDGRLFIADAIRNIYEIDRTNGNVIHSFTLPVTGIIGALTGGFVLPEPATMFPALLAAIWSFANMRSGHTGPRNEHVV
jgi:hypothetical protein